MANGMTSDVISTLGAECGNEMSFPFAKEDVFAFEIGIVGEDVLNRAAGADLSDNNSDSSERRGECFYEVTG